MVGPGGFSLVGRGRARERSHPFGDPFSLTRLFKSTLDPQQLAGGQVQLRARKNLSLVWRGQAALAGRRAGQTASSRVSPSSRFFAPFLAVTRIPPTTSWASFVGSYQDQV